jgi:hypothetical protein
MAEPYKSGVWPYPRGVYPREPAPERQDQPPEPEPDPHAEPVCARCGSPALRARGFYRSVRWGEVRQTVECKTCKRFCYLPVGQRLPRQAKKATLETFVVGEDERPCCPWCSGDRIQRKGVLPCGSQRWFCRDCAKRFVSKAFRHAQLDRRKVSHFEPEEVDDALEEATSLFALVHTESDVAEVRDGIAVTELEKRVAEFFCPAGLVSQVLGFRDDVMEYFDQLIEEKRKADFNRLVAATNTQELVKETL